MGQMLRMAKKNVCVDLPSAIILWILIFSQGGFGEITAV